MWLRLRLLPDDFFEPLELIQTQQHAIPSEPLFECFEPISRGFQRRLSQPRQRLPLLRPSLFPQPLLFWFAVWTMARLAVVKCVFVD